MVCTVTEPLELRDRVLPDPDLAEAILERSCIVTPEGPSMWTRHRDAVADLSDRDTAV